MLSRRHLLTSWLANQNKGQSLSATYIRNELNISTKKVQVGKDQEKAQSEKDSHSKNRGGKKPN